MMPCGAGNKWTGGGFMNVGLLVGLIGLSAILVFPDYFF
jgi:hypothetical protein